MALDGTAVYALVEEFKQKLTDKRIDKISQPEDDEIIISFHGFGESYKLLLTANASIARACITSISKQNPQKAPMFCMLLRKCLGGGKLIAVTQPNFERIIRFTFESYDEMGDLTKKHLIIEIMGRHSNIILLDDNDKILDSIKRVDLSVSSVRQVLPGLMYENPPDQGKVNPLSENTEGFLKLFEQASSGEKLDAFLISKVTGISPLTAREIVSRSVGDVSKFVTELDYNNYLDVASTMSGLFKKVSEGSFKPCYLINKQNGKMIDFSAIDIKQYGELAEVVYKSSVSELIDEFYFEKDKKERITSRASNLTRLVSNNIERIEKKLHLQEKELKDTEKKEKFRQYGELLTANLYKAQQGEKSITVENFYDENFSEITIPLDETLSPSKNAQRYFKKYNKAKTAQEELVKQIKIANDELSYFRSVEFELSNAENEQDLKDISDELASLSYIRRPQMKRKKESRSQPDEFHTKDGFTILVGRNNRQNDYLTTKLAKNSDMWFHTKNIHGSHVVLKYEYGREFSDEAVEAAASLAAYYSKAKNSQNVPVDYTFVKYVKKPGGAKPGLVIYTDNKTCYVMPKKELN